MGLKWALAVQKSSPNLAQNNPLHACEVAELSRGFYPALAGESDRVGYSFSKGKGHTHAIA